jgi:hypothetical protein
MDKNLKIILTLLVAAIFFVGCTSSPTGKTIAVGNEQEQTVAPQENPADSKSVDISAAVNIPAKTPLEVAIDERLKSAENIKKRQTDLPAIFFKNLPPFPEDFYRIRILVLYSKISNLDLLSENYWKQPEFLPGFEESAVRLIKNPQPNRWGAFGFGIYPGDTRVFVSPGTEFNVTTFVHTSWLVETYQGIRLVTEYQKEIMLPYQDLQESQKIVQDPERVKQYFDVSVSPEVLVLEPSFPIMEKDWIQKVKVYVKVKPETPPGTYVIGVTVGTPPADFNDKMMMRYLNVYTTGGTTTGVGRSFYQIAVVVK